MNFPNTYNGKKYRHHWIYRDSSKKEIGLTVRYDDANGKEVIPFFKKSGVTFEMGGAPEPRPLFGLESLSQVNESNFLLIPEGEKCAAALHSIGFSAVTSCGGSGQAHLADWSPINGIGQIILLPDADKPGEKYIQTVFQILKTLPKLPTSIKILRIPELKDSQDIVDLIKQNLNDWDEFSPVPEKYVKQIREMILELITNSEDAPPEWLIPVKDGWENPIPLEEFSLPPWPEDIFPLPINNYVGELSVATETPIELPAMMTFAVLATSVAGKFVVEVKSGHIEQLCLWTCVALPPASLKTAIVKEVTAPLLKWEQKQREEIEPKIRECESLKLTLEEKIKKKRREAIEAINESDCEMIQKEIVKLEKQIPSIPSEPQLWTDDVTAERLAVLLKDNDERMAIISDEGGIFENIGGRYSGGIPNLDIYLKGHSASLVRVDRQGRSAVKLNRPCLSMGLAPQPDVMRSLGNKNGFRGRGLLARFLYALPLSNLGKRTRSAPPLSDKVSSKYEEIVIALLNQPWARDLDGSKIPKIIRFDDESVKLFHQFDLEIEKQLGDGGRFANMRDWAGKLVGTVARLAGIIHAARYAEDMPENNLISPIDLKAAIAVGRCLAEHALAAFNLIGTDPVYDDARSLLIWIKKNEKNEFTKRDAHKHNNRRFERAVQVQAALDLLEERGYIIKRKMPNPAHRPSDIYDVNPLFLSTKETEVGGL